MEEDIRARTARKRPVGMDILRVCVVVGAGGSQNHFIFHADLISNGCTARVRRACLVCFCPSLAKQSTTQKDAVSRQADSTRQGSLCTDTYPTLASPSNHFGC